MWPAVHSLGVRLDGGARCKFDLAEVERSNWVVGSMEFVRGVGL